MTIDVFFSKKSKEMLSMTLHLSVFDVVYQYVPHKAVAEVSKIGNL